MPVHSADSSDPQKPASETTHSSQTEIQCEVGEAQFHIARQIAAQRWQEARSLHRFLGAAVVGSLALHGGVLSTSIGSSQQPQEPEA
ncbi:MAG: hypothetical protein HC857_02000, partial [Synechococcales cyanobacterium RU_4_20]|nr:hypothetical protein [Synechococcales cyanobacterium RU_4_20]